MNLRNILDTTNFESRMYQLERNGYSNVVGLQRRYAIEVDDYDEKETLLDDIFSKSNVPNTELFALDVDLVIQLLSSFDGKQIYPENTSKEVSFVEATEERNDRTRIPNGIYYLSENRRDFGVVKAKMQVNNGQFIVLKGSDCAPVSQTQIDRVQVVRKTAVIKNNILQENMVCNSPSTAALIVLGRNENGWFVWKDEKGNFIDVYR